MYSDDELLKLALSAPTAGKDRAGELLLRFAPSIRRFVSSRVPQSEVDDIVSIVLERAARNLKNVREPSVPRFRIWLYQIARHAVVDYYREVERLPVAAPLDSRPALSMEVPPDSLIELRGALEKLSDIDRALLLLSSVHGYRNKEIKDIMARAGHDLSESAIYNRISRARARLKRLLGVTESNRAEAGR